mgnify:CR=1 FL=1|jgi:hypothetical protein
MMAATGQVVSVLRDSARFVLCALIRHRWDTPPHLIADASPT